MKNINYKNITIVLAIFCLIILIPIAYLQGKNDRIREYNEILHESQREREYAIETVQQYIEDANWYNCGLKDFELKESAE